ncbi:glycoside hydrolase family 32 protein [Arthrobacter sp. PAMC25564]|uniref:glycoside hydrolase family 32 protein n=1 Tax=Arthrobacter sp. PAMC25564 TaxID=2565366 RepID=UPI0010A267F1|nr:glycoside hydrolase family 32 protein [Arthrobacter sp. PAMC25564]QCB98229.1 glycoside hydrolase family 32 protein [Arthrobacter sp. PAMC25564]
MTAVTATTADTFRPALHYAARNTWLNDPNGLIFHEGVYHLYYQNNPLGNVWGNMSWGHASSADLLTWTEHPVAIACDDLEDIFSGSIVFDRHNSSGFGRESSAPLVAVYTSAYKSASVHHGIQAQSLAYSLDGGYTWTKHTGNPVLNRGSSDFRDPKVFRYESDAGSYWVMVAVEAQDFEVVLYKSHDLKSWELLSSFGPANATGGVWECPDLFPLPVDGDPENLKWVLTVNLNPGGPNGGSAGQYFVGDFDGVTFTSAATVTEGLQDPDRLGDYQWLDWGRDYYAAVSFSDVPEGRRLMIAWMNNWQYANNIPTSPWRSPMSLVREVSLHTVDGSLRLVQQVAQELASLPAGHPPFTADVVEISEGTHLLDGAAGSVQRIEATLTAGTAEEFGLIVRGNGTKGTRIGIRPAEGSIVVDRRESGQTHFHESFASIDAAPIEPAGNSYELTIYVDQCSVEVFAQGGHVTMSELIFPASTSTDVSLYTIGGTATLNNLCITQYA